DEYSAIADNNVFTNLMAANNLRAAAEAATRHHRQATDLGVDAEEAASWRDAATAMLIPYDEELGVHPQSEGFTDLAVWDFEATAPEQRPLFLHFPYFDIYRKQVLKQADLVLAIQMCGDNFTPEQKRRDFEYYEALTVRDSSLSSCTQAVVAAEVGHLGLAYDYASEAAFMDLHDIARNTGDGLHMASLAGAWIALVQGFGGLRDDGEMRFSPSLPDGLDGLSFGLLRERVRLRVSVTPTSATYTATGGDLTLHHYGEQVDLTDGEAVRMRIDRPPKLDRPRQPAGCEPQQRHEMVSGTASLADD
ncbi:MAG: family 65 glycosyl hydrolase, partial [Actinomycetota bacterium]|nr:family 65 glycosyl hydrolase [Actinomycetota bacterium]